MNLVFWGVFVALFGVVHLSGDGNIASSNYLVSPLPQNWFERLVQIATGFKVQNGTHDEADCMTSLIASAMALAEKQPWALKLLDAQFKPGAGILHGRIHHMGAFDECLQIEQRSPLPCRDGKPCHIRGQYCSWSVDVPINQIVSALGGFRVGVCLPTYCTERAQHTLLSNLSQQLGYNVSLIRCDDATPAKLDVRQIIIILIYSFILLALVTGLVLDFIQRIWEVAPSGTIGRAFLAFSPLTNGEKILKTTRTSGTLDCLHGIRFLSMCWVILGHTYAFANYRDAINLIDLQSLIGTVPIQIIFNGTLSVDTFFFIGGLLVSYVTLKEMQRRGGRISWAHFLFHRVWRLTPAYALAISLMYLWRPIGSGPTWVEAVEGYTKPCDKTWWATLLYVNNFVKDSNRCMGHGWYLSNDMQFYFISPIILYLLFKYEPFGHALNALLVFVSCLITGILIDLNKYRSPTFSMDSAVNYDDSYKDDVYIKPYTRIAPYCLGITVGQLVLCHMDEIRRHYLSKRPILIGGWTAAAFFFLAPLFGTRPWNEFGAMDSMTAGDHAVTAIYGATFRLGWTFSIAWIVLTCVAGYGGPINDLLGWSPFMPLGRLTFMAYLIHPFILYDDTGRSRTNFYFSGYIMVIRWLSYLVVAYLLAFVASLAFEAPFVSLEKVLFKRSGRKRDSKSRPTSVHSITINDTSTSRL